MQVEDVVRNTHHSPDGAFSVIGGRRRPGTRVGVVASEPVGGDGRDKVTLTWRMTDVSGVSFATAWVRSPNGTHVSGCGGSSASRTSGSASDGTYAQMCTIPTGAVDGAYTVWVQAEDVVGNTHHSPDGSFTVVLMTACVRQNASAATA